MIDTLTTGVAVQPGRVVLVGRGSDARSALLALGVGDSVRVALPGGAAFAAARHPRTAVGIGRNGQRLLLVVVDGRQKPYSDGMTLPELAEVMRGLGARDAINLDGGGSTTMVYAEPGTANPLRIANRPSDPAGERPVGDALAIVRGCRAGR